jgi:hypothetical protein
MLVSVLSLAVAADLGAQRPAAAPTPATPTAQATAPVDITGYWVSIVTEAWRYRMMVPDKNDYPYIPLNPEGRRVASTWDMAKEVAGDQCKAYGAPALLHVPGRLHIYWQDANTLRVDTDSGTQTRLFHFGASAKQGEAPTRQGYSAASWEGDEPVDTRDGFGGPVQDASGNLVPRRALRKADYLKSVTTHMLPGFLQKNGVPYSGNAMLEEDFDTFKDPYAGDTWLTLTTVVDDPQYLIEPLFMHAHFKKIPDRSGWDPTPCRADQPR